MKNQKLTGWGSVAVHGGHKKDPSYAHLTPLYASSTYVFDSAEQGMRRFTGQEEGYIYGRWGNPTITEAEQKIAALETFGTGKEATAILHSSGMAAITTLMMSTLSQGDKILSHFSLYGGTDELVHRILPRFGVSATIVDLRDLEKAEELVGVVVGLAGIGWMLLPGGTRPVSGTDGDVVFWSVMVLISSTIWATASFFSARMPTPRDSFALTAYELLSGGVALLLVSVLVGERVDLGDITVRSWGGWLFLVIAGSVIAFTSFTWLINKAPISLASTYAYVNPAVAVLLGLLLYAEAITSDVVVGLTIVLGGVILVVSGESILPRRRRSPSPDVPVT